MSIARVAPESMEDASSPERVALASVVGAWLRTRAMSTMRFLVDVQPFGFARSRRYYLAMHEGRAVGALVAVPVFAREGWFFEDVLRAPAAPNGTVELLVDAAMDDAKREGARFATLGLAPLARISDEPGPQRATRRALAFCYRHLGVLYPFATLAAFKQRFVPDAWTVQHLVLAPPHRPALALAHVLRAFTGMRMTAFGVATVRRLAARLPPRVRRGCSAAIALMLLAVAWMALARAHG